MRPGERGLVLVVLFVLVKLLLKGGACRSMRRGGFVQPLYDKQTIAYLQQDAEEGEQGLAHDGARRLELCEEGRDEGRGVRQRLLFG
jgi:hypothetical protein